MAENNLFSVIDGTFLDNGFIDAIEDTAVWAQYGLSEIFETTADDIALNGESAIVAAGAANIGAVIASAAYTGSVIAATAGVASLAIGGGVAVGVLINHIVSNWGGSMSTGKYIPAEGYINFYLAEGGGAGSINNKNHGLTYTGFDNYNVGYSDGFISIYNRGTGKFTVFRKIII